MKRPVRTHDARVANRRAVPVPVAFVRLKVNRRMDVARASCDRTPRARRSTRERSSERERRVRFGSIDRSIDRSPTDSDSDLIFIHSFVTTRGTRGARERRGASHGDDDGGERDRGVDDREHGEQRRGTRDARARETRGVVERERERERERDARDAHGVFGPLVLNECMHEWE